MKKNYQRTIKKVYRKTKENYCNADKIFKGQLQEDQYRRINYHGWFHLRTSMVKNENRGCSREVILFSSYSVKYIEGREARSFKRMAPFKTAIKQPQSLIIKIFDFQDMPHKVVVGLLP